jgi:hypothetical protein
MEKFGLLDLAVLFALSLERQEHFTAPLFG